MIEKMLEHDFVNKSVLDLGTGTGVLAVLSEKLGALEITAIDMMIIALRMQRRMQK